jgi:N-acetylglutamate synthase-like GNAT family acetyltransferase
VSAVVRVARAEDLPAIHLAYAAWHYPGRALDTDRIFIAEHEGALAGIVRRTVEDGITMLRGMHVNPALHRRGIGTALLCAFDADLAGAECTCTPYAHLDRFYGQIGFRPMDESAAPAFLTERLARYRAEGRQMLLMRRAARPPGARY